MSTPNPKPQPVVVTTICSLCDQPWEDHGDDPTTADCIRLLKARLLATPQVTYPIVIYRDRWPSYSPNTWSTTHTPQWTYTNTANVDEFGRQLMSTYDSGNLSTNVLEFRTPRDDDDDGPQSVRC